MYWVVWPSDLKAKFLEEEKLVDIVVGPDAYRSLLRWWKKHRADKKAVERIIEQG